MSAIGNAIKDLREERGWTQADLAEKVGIDRTNLARRENGTTRVKPFERRKFAEVFEMSLADFDQLWRDWRVERTRGGNGIPIINRAPAGVIMDYEEYGVDSGQGYEYIDFGDITDEMAFGVVVVGDSMQPVLNDGDYVILSPCDPYKSDKKLENGRVALVRFTNEHSGGCTLARFFAEDNGAIRLQKDNPRYKAIECTRDDIQHVSVAVERRVKL